MSFEICYRKTRPLWPLLALIVGAYAAVLCPEINSNYPVYLPDRTNCSKFYVCDNGVPWAQVCPNQSYFNQKLNVCDKPENVIACEFSGVYIKPHCQCTKYVVCQYGTPQIVPCPSGYHFNRKKVQIQDLGIAAVNVDYCDTEDCE